MRLVVLPETVQDITDEEGRFDLKLHKKSLFG